MLVLVYADEKAQEWPELLTARGYKATILPRGTPVPQGQADICLVVVSDPLAERFWMANLTMPTLLVTGALGPAQALGRRVPSLRLICHPSRAAGALDDMLQMTRDIHDGMLVLGPMVEQVQVARRWGSRYADN